MNGSTTDVIVARSHDIDRLSTMIMWSIVAHVVVTAVIVFLPHPQTDLRPEAVMTISLGGPPGPRTGMTPIGQRSVQAPLPPEVKKPESAPARVTPEMTLPNPRTKQPQVRNAPKEATAKTPSTGETPQEGPAKAETRVRGQGFGLSGGGGGAGGVQLDISGEFCCPEYILAMKSLIEQSWNRQQGLIGITTMKFTIQKDGSIQDVQVEKPSGFTALDVEANRALLRTMRLPPLPRAYPNSTLTVHLGFAYERP